MTNRRILALSATPLDKDRLRLEKEIREIRNVIKISELRDQIELHDRGAVRPDDLQQHLLEIKPQIIHFSGHSSSKGLMVETESGKTAVVSPSTLSTLLDAWVQREENTIHKFEVIVLNSCYSGEIAQAICKVAEYVIGMPEDIDDDSAIAFARGFYRGISAGWPIKASFQFGCSAIQLSLENLPLNARPILIHNCKTILGGLEVPETNYVELFPSRAQFLWRLAYSFLFLDQLPSGGWGRTLNSWMESIWEGDMGSIPRNPNMRISGGTDLTAYTFYHYYIFLKNQLSPMKAIRLLRRNGVADKVYENFKSKIGYQGGIGTRQMPRGGSLPDVRIRHTIMGIITFLVYGEAKQFSANIQEELNTTCHYLEEQLPWWVHDQTHLFAMVAIAIKFNEILSQDVARRQLSGHQIERLRSLLKRYIPEMIELVNRPTSYTPSPGGTIKGPLRGSIFPPYYDFWRMERSNFLMYFPFLLTDDGKSFLEFVSEDLQIRCGQILAELLEEIEYPYNDAEPLKCLLRFHRASDLLPTDANEPPPDWGLSAEFAALLKLSAVEQLLLQNDSVGLERFRQKEKALQLALLNTFDSYNRASSIFRFTNGSSFGRILSLFSVDSIKIAELEKLDSVISKMSSEGITEKDIVALIEGQVVSKVQGDTRIDSPSVEDLLLAKLESGEYTPDGVVCDTAKWQRRIQETAKNSTIAFYNSELADLHIERYGSAPQVDLISVVADHFKVIDKSCKALDVGCGVGQYAELLVKQGFDVKLLDASSKMLDLACARLKLSRDSFTPTNIFDTSWGYPDAFFDLIFACAIMVHIPKGDAPNICRMFYRLLKPDGILFVNYKIGDHTLISKDGRFFEYYRNETLPRKELENAGFRIEDMTLTTNYKNMYLDPKQIRWANFYCKKAIN
jgi:SAM-dependent methyltransferase